MVNNRVLTIAGAKGGVGKTTTSLNLAAGLKGSGLSVVAVEMDLPLPNFVDFLDFEFTPLEDPSLQDVLDDTAGLQDAVYDTTAGFSVIPSASDMETYEQTDLSRFHDIIDELRWYFDIVFIDTPAGLSEEAKESLAAADEAIIVSTPRVASIQNANKTIDLARRQGANIRGFLLNKSGTGASPGVDTIAEAVDIEILGHIPEDEAVPHAQDAGDPVVTHSPNSAAGIAYQRVASELLGNQRITNPEEHPPDTDSANEGTAASDEPPSNGVSIDEGATADESAETTDDGSLPAEADGTTPDGGGVTAADASAGSEESGPDQAEPNPRGDESSTAGSAAGSRSIWETIRRLLGRN